MISLLKRQGPKWISTFNQKSLYPIVCGISNYSINKSSWCLLSTSKDDSTSFQNTSEPKTGIKKKRVPLVNVSELSVDDICSLLKSRSISNEDIEHISFALAYRDNVDANNIDTAIQSLIRLKKYPQVMQFYQLLSKKHPDLQLSTRSMEFIFDSLIYTKHYHYFNIIWNRCSNEDKNRWGIQSRYNHCLIANHQLESARPFLNRMQREEYTIPVANSSILQGLYEGGYYDECVNMLKGLLPLDPTFKILGDPLCLRAGILAACRLKQYVDAVSFFSVCSQIPCSIDPSTINSISKVGISSWKAEYNRIIEGKAYSKKQLLHVLAQSRLSQLLEGGKVINNYFKVQKTKRKNVVDLSRDYEETRKLHLIGVFDDLSSSLTDHEDRSIEILTVVNDQSIRRFLRSEVWPSIEFEDHNNRLIIPTTSIVNWVNHRRESIP